MKSYNNLQSGGAAPAAAIPAALNNINFRAVQESALKKKAEILLQRNSINELNDNIAKLSQGFKPINDVLGNVKLLIDSIKINLPDLNKANPPSVDSWSALAQYNLYHNHAWDSIVKVGPTVQLLDVNGNINYLGVFDNKPDENGETPGDDTDRKDIVDYLEHSLGRDEKDEKGVKKNPLPESTVKDWYCSALKEIHGVKAACGNPAADAAASPAASSEASPSGLPAALPESEVASASPKAKAPGELGSKYRFF